MGAWSRRIRGPARRHPAMATWECDHPAAYGPTPPGNPAAGPVAVRHGMAPQSRDGDHAMPNNDETGRAGSTGSSGLFHAPLGPVADRVKWGLLASLEAQPVGTAVACGVCCAAMSSSMVGFGVGLLVAYMVRHVMQRSTSSSSGQS